MMDPTTRRDFLRLAAAAGLSLPLDGCSRAFRQGDRGAIHCAGPASLTDGATFDYVVIGSGAGGGPVAANLATAGFRVALLEAGGDETNPNYSVPMFHGFATEDETFRWDYFVKHYEDPDRRRRDSKYVARQDGVLYPRAGTLGGCTAHNAMITVYPHNSDWDGIAQVTGDASWASESMRRYFERLEQCRYVHGLIEKVENPGRHGFDGWLTTSMADPTLVIKDKQLLAMIASIAEGALREDIGRPLDLLKSHFDPNDWRLVVDSPEGVFGTPLATKEGRRTGTREYLQAVAKACPANLTIVTHALATRILLNGDKRATGVEYLQGPSLYRADPRAKAASNGVRKTIQARREVILSAGAFNSPQLLKLSGIGPRDELTGFGIETLVDLPGVGENLQDRYEIGVITEMDRDFQVLRDCTFEPPAPDRQPDQCFADWQNGTGVYTTNGLVISLIKRSRPERPLPDLYIFGVPSYFKGYFPTYSSILRRHKNYFTWAILKAHTQNTAGRITLRSADPRDVPEINFHYFDESNDRAQEDLESVVEGIEFVRRVSRKAQGVIKREVLPGPDIASRDDLRTFVRNEAWSHHASCSNKMGPATDPLAVVDSRFRVHGTKNLRVVDASVFPRIPGFFIVSAIYMISEKASDVIAEDARGADGRP